MGPGAHLERVCSVPDRTRSRLDKTGNTEFVYFRLFWCIITFHSTTHNVHALMNAYKTMAAEREIFNMEKPMFGYLSESCQSDNNRDPAQ